jgi:hypothetical protein
MGLQCQKLLWFRYNAKDQIPAPDEATQAVFDQGKEVGELAHQLFLGGTVVAPTIISPSQVVAETQKAIQARQPLHEAAFSFHGGYARTDLLVPADRNAWDLVEVKSTTSLKEEVHVPDIAFQAFVLAGAGIKVRKCFLAHINNEFVRQGAIDPRKFFTLEEVTRPAAGLSRDVGDQLDAMQRVIAAKSHPIPRSARTAITLTPARCMTTAGPPCLRPASSHFTGAQPKPSTSSSGASSASTKSPPRSP